MKMNFPYSAIVSTLLIDITPDTDNVIIFKRILMRSNLQLSRLRQMLTIPIILTVFFSMTLLLSLVPFEAQASGGSYTLKWHAADPSINGAPYLPTYEKLKPSSLLSPGTAGRYADPLPNAVAYGPTSNSLDAVTSLAPKDMALGQVVPYEMVIAVSGSTAPENGTIQFTTSFATNTTPGSDFGFDPAYRVYAAFVDAADAGTIDPEKDAKVDKFTSTLKGSGTSQTIEGTFNVSGLDDGDKIVVEIWVVLKSSIPSSSSGNVPTDLISAQTSDGSKISTGAQTVPLLRVGSFFTSQADISVVKTDSPDPVIQGQNITYSLIVKNNSPDTIANGINVTDTLDSNTSFVSATGASYTISGHNITFHIGALSPGNSSVIQIFTLVSNKSQANNDTSIYAEPGTSGPVPSVYDLINTVSETAITSDSNMSNNVYYQPTNVLLALPVYFLEKKVLDVAGKGPTGDVTTVGDIIKYQINVSNVGNIDLTNITLNDSLISLTGPTGDIDAIGILNTGETWTYKGNYTVTQADINSNGGGNGLIENTAIVDCDQLLPKNRTVEVPVKADPAYIIDKKVVNVAGNGSTGSITSAGNIISYQIRVSNTGNVDLTNVTLNDSLINLTGPVESLKTDNILGVGEVWTYNGNYTATQADIDTNGGGNGLIENTATVDCYQLDPKSKTVEVPVKADTAYIIDKLVTDVAGNGPTGIVTSTGNVISYQINVTNVGNVVLTNVTLSDSLINPIGPAESLNTNGVLEPGEIWTFHGNYTVTKTDIDTNGGGNGLIENTATVDCDQLNPKSQTVEVPIKADPAYIIDKKVTDVNGNGPTGSVTSAGNIITYQINISNVGNVDLINVTVSDSLINLDNPVESLNSNGALEPGEIWTFNGSYTVTQTDIDTNGGGNGLIENTATVDCDQLAPKSQTVEVPVRADPAYIIDKKVTDVAGNGSTGLVTSAGNIITYLINVSNVGNVDLTNVTVSDSLINLDNPVESLNSNGALEPGEIWTFNGSYTVTQTDIDTNGGGNGLIENTATVDCDQLNPKSQAVEVPIKADPVYIIDKKVTDVAGNGSAGLVTSAGNIVTYLINVSNVGNVDLTNVTVSDSLINLDNPVESLNSNGVLEPGEIWTYNGSYTVTQTDIDTNGEGNGLIENTATVDCDQLDPKSRTVEVPVRADPAYIIDKKVTDVASNGPAGYVTSAGNVIRYQINISNVGNVDLTNITLSDSLIDLTIPVESLNTNGILEPGEVWTCNDSNYTVTQTDIDTNGGGNGLIENTATVDCDQLAPKSQTVEVPVRADPSYIIDKKVTDIAGHGPTGDVTAAGELISYQINVTNVGNVGLTNVTLSDSLINPIGPTESLNTNGVLDPGEIWTYSGTYTVTQTDIDTDGGGNGLIENTATVDCDQLTPKSYTVEVPVKADPAYIIDKEITDVAGNGPAGYITVAGNIISYQINVSNVGNVGLTNVTLSDSLINPIGPTESLNSNGVLDPGEIWTYSGSYTVTQTDIDTHKPTDGIIENTATVDCDQLTSKSHTAEVPISGSTAYIIDKKVTDVAGNGPSGHVTSAGDIISYQINVTNVGITTLTGVTLNDPMINLLSPTESLTINSVLDPGEVWTYSGNYTVTQTDIDTNGGGNGLIENTATVDCDTLDPKSHTAEVPVNADPAYIIDKKVTDIVGNGPAGYVTLAGDKINYQINVTNVGNVGLTNVTLSDSLINPIDPAESLNTNGILDPGEIWTYNGNYTVKQTDIDTNGGGNGLIENTATVDCDQLDPKSNTKEVPVNADPVYIIDKKVTDIVGNGSVGYVTSAGNLISYQINISNVGNVGLTNITLSDSLINLTGPAESLNTNGILDPGEIWTYNGNYTVNQTDIDTNGGGNGLIENTATVDCDQLDPKSNTKEVPLQGSAAYIIDKKVTSVIGNGSEGYVTSAGDTISYQINVSNVGSTSLTNITLSDSLINLTGPAESLTINSVLDPGEIWTYDGNYTVNQTDIDTNGGGNGLIENTATVGCDQLDPKSNTKEVPLQGSAAYIIDKKVTSVIGNGSKGYITSAGDTISYQINVTNVGSTSLTNVTLKDPMINLTGPAESLTINSVLDPGEIWTYDGNYTVNQTDIDTNGGGNGLIENTATVDCDQLDPKSNTKEVPVNADPIYIIDKKVTDIVGNRSVGYVTSAGNLIIYQINISNVGNVGLTNITLSDSLINLTGPAESLNTNGILDPGEIWTYNGNYTVNQTDIDTNGGGNGLIENTATVDCDQLTSKSHTVEVPLQGSAAYIIDKKVTSVIGNGSAGYVTSAGDNISYQINVSNVGSTSLTNITLNDPMITFTGPEELVNSNGVLDPGEIWTYNGNYTVNQTDVDTNGGGDGVIENTATVDCDQLTSKSYTAEVPIKIPAYIISKIVTDAAGTGPTGYVTSTGDIISYQINVSNVGDVNLTNVTLNDSLINLTRPTESLNNNEILEIGETWIYTGNYTVTQTDIIQNGTVDNGYENISGSDGDIDNIATVDCDQLGPKSQTAEVPIKSEPAYIVSKIVRDVAGRGPSGYILSAGDTIFYHFNVTNTGNVNLTNITLGTRINITELVESLNPDGILEPREVWSYNGTYTVTQKDLEFNGTQGINSDDIYGPDGDIDNYVTVDCDQLEPQTRNTEVKLARPVFRIEKTITDVAGAGPAGDAKKEGDVISYQINVSNAGNIDLADLTVNDPLMNLTNKTGDDEPVGILNTGETWVYTGNYTVTQDDINNTSEGKGFVTNTATISSTLLGTENDSAIVPIVLPLAYTIEKTVIDIANKGPEGSITAAGDVISYQINVTNIGKVNLTNITLNDSLVNLTDPTESLNVDSVLEIGESWTYNYSYTVTQADINNHGIEIADTLDIGSDNDIDNVATVDCDQLDSKSHTVELPIVWNPQYSIFKSVINPDARGDCIINSPGDEIPYRIVVKNEGNIELINVTVNDTLINLEGPVGNDTEEGVLHPGETWIYTGVYTLTANDVNNGNINNTATVRCEELLEKSTTVNTAVDQNAELSIYKSVTGIDEAGDRIINEVGDIIQYQVVIKNNGNVDLTGVSLSDPMVTLTKTSGDTKDPEILNPREVWVYAGNYTVTQEDMDNAKDGVGVIENTATVSCNQLSNESSSLELPITYISPIVLIPESENSTILPVANFNTNVTSGYVPLFVQFTDSSQNATTWSWDFGDGYTSTEQNPAHTYTTAGNYTVKLTVSNAKGNASRTVQIRVLQPGSGNGGSGVGSYNNSGGGDSEGKAVVVRNNANVSSTANTNTTANVTPTESNTGQSSTPAKVEQTQEQQTTGTPAKEGKQEASGFEIICGITALMSVFLFKKK